MQGPTQHSKYGHIVTVVTNKAYSAAANLLAFGNYSVALKHTSILCHDVRFGEMADVTPSKALSAAKSLQDENDRFALKLANQVIRRLVWVYLDLYNQHKDINQKYPQKYQQYQRIITTSLVAENGAKPVDIAGFATILYAHLSIENNTLIDSVMTRFAKWIFLTNLSNSYPTYRLKGSRKPGVLDGVGQLYKDLNLQSNLPESCEDNLKLMITLMTAELNRSDHSIIQTVEEATRNFNLIQSMNDISHRQAAIRIMLRHQAMFFNESVEGIEDAEKKLAIDAAMPYAQLFWLFCVSLCRELFEGEHVLSPADSQLLGLVDEVPGDGLVESRREFGVKEQSRNNVNAS